MKIEAKLQTRRELNSKPCSAGIRHVTELRYGSDVALGHPRNSIKRLDASDRRRYYVAHVTQASRRLQRLRLLIPPVRRGFSA